MSVFVRSVSVREEFGDWQTSYDMARNVCLHLKGEGVRPTLIVEPTCGVGNFLAAALDVFDMIDKVYGVEICDAYVRQTEEILRSYLDAKRISSYELYCTDVFDFDFGKIARENPNASILVLGNPPWVTTSGMGKADGTNLPVKGNIDGLRGIEAMTGKGNFDIAESICNKLIDAFSLHRDTYLALLVKNSVVRNILYRQHIRPRSIHDIRQSYIDAKREFGVSACASLLELRIGGKHADKCALHDFYSKRYLHDYGWVGDAFVSNVQGYGDMGFLDGQSPLVWRSGVKHDCTKVMELSLGAQGYVNGLGEIACVDDDTVYPLLKSSDIGKGYRGVRKYLLLPQTSLSEDTAFLKLRAPKTYDYLSLHAAYLDRRKSTIYRNKPRFCVFGLGPYSFAPYKIVISSLYSELIFSLVEPVAGKPVMLDDTCYQLGFDEARHARLTLFLLQSEVVRRFIRSISFDDAKRVISRELLMRIDLYRLSKVVDYSSAGVTQDVVCEYQEWLRMQSAPTLFRSFV